MTLSTLPEYATPNEWAEAFNVSLRTVYRMCSLGKLMTVKVRGSILIYRDSSFVLLGLAGKAGTIVSLNRKEPNK